MASNAKKRLYQATEVDDDGESDDVVLEQSESDYIIEAVMSNNHADTTVDFTVQHSTNGQRWYDLVAVTQLTNAAKNAIKRIDVSVLGRIRVKRVLGGVTKLADLEVNLYYNPRK